MELRQLRYFIAAAEVENFTAAAKKMNVVQPALCRQINHLEDELGFLLFERLKRGVKLTRAGKSFLRDARAGLKTINQGVKTAEEIAGGGRGTLRVGFSESAAYDPVYSRLIASFRAEHPEVRLQLTAGSSASVLESLEKGELDFGFLYEYGETIPGCNLITISAESFVLAVPEDHRFGDRKHVRIGELVGEEVVWIQRQLNPHYYDSILHSLSQRGVRLSVSATAPNDPMMLALVAAGAGVSFIGESASNWRPNTIKLIKIRDLDIEIVLKGVWLASSQDPLLETMIAHLKSALN